LLQAHPKGAYVKIIPEENKIIGFTRANEGGVPENFACYFVAYLDQPFKAYGVWQGGQPQSGVKELSAEEAGAYLQFQGPVTVTMRLATSFISFEQAERNLANEIGSRRFEQTRQEAKEIWEKEMHKIEIEGATPEQQITFYTAMYRALLFPRIWYELGADQKKIHFSPYDGKVHPGEMYADNGFWDTFRAVYPFFTLLHPERDAEIIRGWINAYKEGGWFPKWTSPGYRDCMIGTHVESLVADAYLKGIRDFDVEAAWQAMIKDGTTPTDWGGRGRVGLPEYVELGYVACDKTKDS
jgi:predicted alpha-1,2-mannosidase